VNHRAEEALVGPPIRDQQNQQDDDDVEEGKHGSALRDQESEVRRGEGIAAGGKHGEGIETEDHTNSDQS
jgi:hypothetical protein